MPTLQTPEGFLAECQRRGIKLTAQGGTIKASGKPPANPEKFAAFLKAKKPELLALLQSTDALLSGIPEGHEKARKGAIPEHQKALESLSEAGNPMELSEAGKPHGATPELLHAGPKLQAVAEGRVLVKWPPSPVRVSQGVTTDDPERWFRLAWGRWCGFWHLVHGGKIEGQRHCDVRIALETLTREMVTVLEQGEIVGARED